MWGIPDSRAWQVQWVSGKMHEPYSARPPSPLSLLSFPCNMFRCSSSLDLVKRSSGVAWQQPSAALSLQSPCSAVRLPPESCQDFPLFLHRSTFPSALPNNSNILSHSTLRVSPLPSSFPPSSAVYSLTGYFHPRVACQSPVCSALGIMGLVFVSICWMTPRDPQCHQLYPNYILLSNSSLHICTALIALPYSALQTSIWNLSVRFHSVIITFLSNLCLAPQWDLSPSTLETCPVSTAYTADVRIVFTLSIWQPTMLVRALLFSALLCCLCFRSESYSED